MGGGWVGGEGLSAAVVHLVKRYADAGGMRHVLDLHREAGERIVAVMDGAPSPGVQALGMKANDSFGEVLRRVAEVMPDPAEVIVLHNLWGSPFLRALAGKARVIGYLHTDYPQLGRWLRGMARGVGELVAVDEGLAGRVRAALGEVAPLVWVLPPAVAVPGGIWERRGRSREVVIGYAGRIVRKQKRVDRLPELIRRLDAGGQAYQFEILGAGPDEPWLRRAMGGHPRVKFLGWQRGEAYWEALARWRFGVFCSDYEGLPVALLEMAAAGVEVFYPGDRAEDWWMGRVDPGLIYPPGDMGALASAIAQRRSHGGAARDEYLNKSRLALAEHTKEVHQDKWQRILEAGAARTPMLPGRPWAGKMFPIWAYNRYYRIMANGLSERR